jgi:hypothetical protein
MSKTNSGAPSRARSTSEFISTGASSVISSKPDQELITDRVGNTRLHHAIKVRDLTDVKNAAYDHVKTLVFAWQDDDIFHEEWDAPCDVLEQARAIYSVMYAQDQTTTCDTTTLIKDYNALVQILRSLKTYYSDSTDLGSCIANLEYAIQEIPRITHTEDIVCN